jgi:hypothetical protein
VTRIEILGAEDDLPSVAQVGHHARGPPLGQRCEAVVAFVEVHRLEVHGDLEATLLPGGLGHREPVGDVAQAAVRSTEELPEEVGELTADGALRVVDPDEGVDGVGHVR